jgi:galactokinase
MVAAQTVPGKFAIIDTGTEELLHFDAPRRSHMCWGVLDTGSPPHEVAFFHDRGVLAGEALEILQNDGFPELKSFRDVEHRDLPQMLENLPRRLRPIARHLVNENKRVQSMIGAIQKADWQKLGGLLFMSHASLRDEWNGTDAVVDAVVAHIEAQGSEGMYGACMTGRSGTVLIVGQPLALLRSITGLKEMLQADYKKCPKALVL